MLSLDSIASEVFSVPWHLSTNVLLRLVVPIHNVFRFVRARQSAPLLQYQTFWSESPWLIEASITTLKEKQNFWWKKSVTVLKNSHFCLKLFQLCFFFFSLLELKIKNTFFYDREKKLFPNRNLSNFPKFLICNRSCLTDSSSLQVLWQFWHTNFRSNWQLSENYCAKR